MSGNQTGDGEAAACSLFANLGVHSDADRQRGAGAKKGRPQVRPAFVLTFERGYYQSVLTLTNRVLLSRQTKNTTSPGFCCSISVMTASTFSTEVTLRPLIR